jgi:hypothetical protein
VTITKLQTRRTHFAPQIAAIWVELLPGINRKQGLPITAAPSRWATPPPKSRTALSTAVEGFVCMAKTRSCLTPLLRYYL